LLWMGNQGVSILKIFWTFNAMQDTSR
jgi:hypothetical protein